MLYVMLGLFVVSMAYFIFIIRKETNTRRQKLMENFGSDLIPYVRYSQASIILLYLTAGLLPVAILFNTLLYIIGPLMLLSVIFFIHTFIAMGYYITPKEVISEEDAEEKEEAKKRLWLPGPVQMHSFTLCSSVHLSSGQ